MRRDPRSGFWRWSVAGRGVDRKLLAAWAAVALAVGSPAACGAQSPADGEAALRAGRYEEAIEALGSRARSGGDVLARRGFVRALMEVGRYEEAEREARRFVAEDSTSPELANVLGEVLYLRGKREEAEAAFRRAAGRGRDGLRAELNLAILRFERGEREAALAAFDRFIDVYNESDRPLTSEELTAVATAVRYLGAEDPQLFKDALRAYDEAIAADPGNLEARVLLGELFLEKYNGADARATFEEALKLNPNHPRALLGLARALDFGDERGAVEQVEKALAVNPNLVPARVFLARLRLAGEEYEEAEAEVERALEVNPASLEALALLAAIRHLRGDRAGFEALERRALAVNPRGADFYNEVAELSVQHRRYREAVEFARRAVGVDARSWRGHGILGINQLRVGAIDEGRASLETAFRGDPYNVWIKNTLDLLDSFSRYRTVRTARFELVIREDEADLLGPYMAELAEEAYDRLAERYGYRPATPIRLEVFPSHADFSVRSVGLTGLGALGVSFGNVLAMDSPSARERGEFNWGSTLWHEVAHAFHLGMTDHRVPRWLTEGLAVHEERRARTGWGQDVSPAFLIAYREGRLPPASRLNNGFVRPSYPEQVIFSYVMASLLVEMIEQERGFSAIAAMLRAYREGRSTEEVLRSVLGTDPESFDRAFDRYLRRRFAGPLAALEGGPSGEFGAELAAGRALLEQGKPDAAAARFERAKSLFPEYAGEDSPYRYLATIYKERGDLRRAAAELEQLTALDESAYDANLELASLLEATGDLAGAARALERAVYIDPFEIPLHVRLAELYSRLGERAKAVRERRAVVALNPVDRAEALYRLARALLEAGDRAAARREVLRALEVAPNYQAAQELLLELSGSADQSSARPARSGAVIVGLGPKPGGPAHAGTTGPAGSSRKR